jgi:elongation factor P--(R)-beta-lysine ligase
LRSDLLQAIRGFFVARGFVEIETPVRLPAPALEAFIDAVPSGEWYLRTSPELHMKRLLAAGMSCIFQVGACFRHGERGQHHSPEFTMLEWYRSHADYMTILEDTEALVRDVASTVLGSPRFPFGDATIDVEVPWERIQVADAFARFAGWDPVANWDADRFDMDLINKVEPALPRDRGVVLIDYPAEVAALARRSPQNPRVAERWELYLGGLELANAFSELTDADEQRRRFEACAAERAAAGREVYPLDRPFLDALEAGMPPSGGIALGIDRLTMLLANVPAIQDVIAFSEG